MANYLDLESNAVVANGVAPVLGDTSGGDVDGTTVDLLNYRYCTFVGSVGTEGDTYSGSVYHEFNVEESADDSSWTDVAAADLTTSVTSISTVTGCFGLVDAAAEAPGVFVTTYIGSSRYVRGVTVAGGTHTNGTPLSLVSIKHGAKILPAA